MSLSSRTTRMRRAVATWLEEVSSPVPAAWFRIGIALFCLLKLWTVRESLLDLYGQYGFVQWAITRGTLPDIVPHLGDVAALVTPSGLGANEVVVVVISIYVGALALLLLGIAARCMALIAWLLNVVLMHAAGGLLYGMDYFTHIGLFYCFVMPSALAISIPSWVRRQRARPSFAAAVTRRMLQVQMCIIYGSSGIEKSLGIQWWNGEAVWRSLTLPVFNRVDVSWLAYVPWLAALAGWCVVAIETGYPVMIWSRVTRAPWLAMTVLMHLGIGALMGMWLFAAIMIILNCGAFGHEAWRDASTVRWHPRALYRSFPGFRELTSGASQPNS